MSRIAEPEEPEVYYAKSELKDIAENVIFASPQHEAIIRWGAWRRRLLSSGSGVRGDWVDEWM